jgi:hypothetical protein
VKVFPLQGTRIAIWYNTAKHIRDNSGMKAAHVWLVNNVPKQFHTIIDRQIRPEAYKE